MEEESSTPSKEEEKEVIDVSVIDMNSPENDHYELTFY